MSKVEFIQYINNSPLNSLPSPNIDGYYKEKLVENMLKENSKDTIEHIFGNAYKVLPYIVDPHIKNRELNKVLCLGKVQSGKTAFFISVISLSFDNGYNLVYLIGGTKNKLKDQNYTRLSEEFCNNPNVKILDINCTDEKEILKLLDEGRKVIVVSLKSVGSINANLEKLECVSNKLSSYPTIIVDDEGDECSPGAPKLKKKNIKAGRTHDVLVNIMNNINICTFFSVTATPQANLLLSTIDEISPDYAVLVEPGDAYTGGNAFHDIYDNDHVIEIKDSDNFVDSIPLSFKQALNFYIFSILYQRYKKIYKPYSMLVHPSSLTIVQSMVAEKIEDYFNYIFKKLNDKNSLAFDEIYNDIFNEGASAVSDFLDYNDFKSKTIEELQKVLKNIVVYEFNVSERGREGIINEEKDKKLYKIYVGGNMLGRGLTIKNLNVTYIYRDSKVSQIDTLYQRARWFGYKKSYFDICRVYMTKELKMKFIDTVENENDMWNSMRVFLLSKINIKSFPRLFTLNNDKLRLTRTSVSKTITVERVNPGYNYDKSIWFTEEQKIENRKLYNSLYLKYKNIGYNKQFGTSIRQQHFIIETKYTEFYNEFLCKYQFPKASNSFGPLTFIKLYNQVINNEIEDKVSIVLMRYKSGERRSSTYGGKSIRELPQGYDNGSNYDGDKSLTGLKEIFHIQIHPVYLDEDSKENIIPLIAVNNPLSQHSLKYVTGDNFYE